MIFRLKVLITGMDTVLLCKLFITIMSQIIYYLSHIIGFSMAIHNKMKSI